MSLNTGLDSPLECGTGTWDWIIKLDCGTGIWDWNSILACALMLAGTDKYKVRQGIFNYKLSVEFISTR